jgi:lysophospholipase L1-like esterase
MKNKFYRSGLAALAIAAFLSSCQPEIDAPEISSGDANFAKYVSLGNSLTSGFADGALYRAGQEVSYPSIIAQQFKLAGGGDFKQPLITVGILGDVGAGTPSVQGFTIKVAPKFVLGTKTDCKGTSLSPVPAAESGDLGILIKGTSINWIGDQGPFNNLGVPGALSYHLVAPGYGSKDLTKIIARQANPFFSRFASSDNTSILQDAMKQNPTFFTLWIGNNDVLSVALAGGEGSFTPLNGPAGVGFNETMRTLVTSLTSGGAKGALANIPDVTKIPYFTTIAYNGLILDSTQATALTQAYAPLGLKFRVGNNPFIIKDNVPGGKRKMLLGELVLLSVNQDSLKCKGLGSQFGISKKDILTAAEVTKVKDAINGYNATIRTLADGNGLAFVDANTYFNTIQQGITINQVNYNAALVTGNVFSLDGLHFSPKGSALAANLFIEAINLKYNAKVPTVNVNAYSGVKFP